MSNEKRRLFIITGMSGAGKSQALKMFGDLGFYCVDNLPLALFKDFINYVRQNDATRDIALGIDVREGDRLKEMPSLLSALAKDEFSVKVIFLNASDGCLIRRFSETKHKHPVHKKLVAAIAHEREVMAPTLKLANVIIDTSGLKLGELKEKLSSLLSLTRAGDMQIQVMSFGFKYGLPKECDIVMDVRFLPNPYYVPELKNKTGLDSDVQDYIMSFKETREFAEKFADLIKYLIPKYIKEGKSYLTIAMGCTGGKHRSVFMAHKLAEYLNKLRLSASEFHRDIGV
ncbi:RNase adapter RapZ [Candidatus Avelusimicrobium caledoniensis]|uniref:RNase adapter RapZ n=1 Tax=Candidatus Avelusimicrobium caledoniensis TaxID=3416220 RepID=UPI003D0F5AEA